MRRLDMKTSERTELLRLEFESARDTLHLLARVRDHLRDERKRRHSAAIVGDYVYFGPYGVCVERVVSDDGSIVVDGLALPVAESKAAWDGEGIDLSGVHIPAVQIVFPSHFPRSSEAIVYVDVPTQ